ncbi:MAG TPA: hypothetical protein DCY94_03320 [Firmicutes bacterium]|nr:hypothetical protein [Bacillota bacterium]
MADDYGTSYYYRGAVTNNYVKFGKYPINTADRYMGYYTSDHRDFKEHNSLSACQSSSNYNVDCSTLSTAGKDMYWRIIRINGDGSIRMQYDGTDAYANANGGSGFGEIDRFIHTNIKWNNYSNDAKYVGWMFGGANGSASTSLNQAQTNTTDSNVKTIVDAWYKANIVDTGLSKYVGDKIFCNDRSTASNGTTWATDENATNKGFGMLQTMYGPAHRIYDSESNKKLPEPTFRCPQKNDAFTVSDTTKGNGALTYPVGLITADEMITAGSLLYNKYDYLYKSKVSYWAFSPSYMSSIIGHPFIFCHSEGGGYSNGYANQETLGVTPVINLSAEYAATLIGNGTMESPYQIPNVN